MLLCYWYIFQCKAFGFTCNRKQKGIVVLTIIRANAILYSKILICIDENIADVGFVKK